MRDTLRRVSAAGALTALAAAGWWFQQTTVHAAGAAVLSYAAAWAWIGAISPLRSRRLAVRAVLVTVLLGFTLALVEIPAAIGRLDYRVAFRTPIAAPIASPAYLPDDELLFRHPPNMHLTGSTALTGISNLYDVADAPERRYDLAFDDRGFRNPPGVDRADIAFVGDSFTEGDWVTYDELWTTLVGKRLGRAVANFGTDAWGPCQELVVLRRHALPAAPRLVVWEFFEGNDLSDVRRYDDVLPRLREVREECHGFGQRSFSKNLLLAITRAVGTRHPSALPRSGLLPLADGSRERTYFMYPCEPLDAGDEKALARVAALLGDANRECRAAGARLLFVYVPDKFRVYEGVVEFAPDALPRAWTGNDLPARVRALVARLDPTVGFLDLTPALRASAAAGHAPYLTNDSHWTAHGHRIAAELTAEAAARLLAE